MDYKEIARYLDAQLEIYDIDWSNLGVERLVMAAYTMGNACNCQDAFEDGYAQGIRHDMEMH